MRGVATTGLCAFLGLTGCGLEYGMVPPEGEAAGAPLEVQTRTVTDGFVQSEDLEALDVLVVVDGSCSMEDDRENVGQGILQLKDDIDAMAAWWSITFITADPTRDDYVGPYTPADATDIDIVMAPALLPLNGGEKTFGAAYMFLESHPELLDPESDLLLFLVSDEDEQSGISPELFDEWLQGVKPNGYQADVVSIVSTSESCSPNVGYKYIDLATIHGKQAVDLCDESWVEWLSQFSFLTAKQDHVPLSAMPVPGTIEVAFDGSSVPAGWVYERASNAVYFMEPPPGGVEVTVTYETQQMDG